MYLHQAWHFTENKYNLFSWGACIAFGKSLNDLDHPDTNKKSNARVPWFSALAFHFKSDPMSLKTVKDLTWISTANRPNNNQRVHTLAYLQMGFWVLLISFHDFKFPFFIMKFYYDMQNWKHTVSSTVWCALHAKGNQHYSPAAYI